MPDDLHDTTVDRLAGRLRDLLVPAGEYVVLSRVRCQLLDGFPTCLTLFDVAVVGVKPCWVTAPDGGAVLTPESAPVLAVNVVAPDTLDEDTIGTPNTLARSAVYEYVLFDPTGEVLRPAFQGFVKLEGELSRSWPALHGVFFSSCDVRLDARGTDLVPSACRWGRLEEELFVLEWERDRLDPADPARAGLDGRMNLVRDRLRCGRTPRGGP